MNRISSLMSVLALSLAGAQAQAAALTFSAALAQSSQQPSVVSAIISRNRLATDGTISILPPPNHCMNLPPVPVSASIAWASTAIASLSTGCCLWVATNAPTSLPNAWTFAPPRCISLRPTRSIAWMWLVPS